MKEIISYGGGTQSSALIIMALDGDYNLPRPDFAVYSDTGAEPEFVNEYIRYFIKLVKDRYDFDIFTIQHKNGLVRHLIDGETKSRNGKFYTSSVPPFFTLSKEGKVGMLMRQCTFDFKTNPLKKLINSKLERGEHYRKWIGISFDERERMKISTEKRVTNYYPLVENFINRGDSITYLKNKGVRPAQRSSCYFCPFHSNRYWEWLKEYHPTEFYKACGFEKAIQQRTITGGTDTYFLHRSCKPLSEVVFSDPDQLNMFPELIDECGGECGI